MNHLTKVLLLSFVSFIFVPAAHAQVSDDSVAANDTRSNATPESPYPLFYPVSAEFASLTDTSTHADSQIPGNTEEIPEDSPGPLVESQDAPAVQDSLNASKVPSPPDSLNPEDTGKPQMDILRRRGVNALYLEMFGNAMNFYSLNFERSLYENVHVRLGGSYFGYSDKLRYEEPGDDIFIELYSVPATVSVTLFDGIRQLELGAGFTFFSFSFWGGPFDVGYRDIELDNRYRGLALTSIIGYRLSINDYLFRLGISPHYMITVDSELSGIFEELEDRGAMEFQELMDFKGFRILPGLSFGRTF